MSVKLRVLWNNFGDYLGSRLIPPAMGERTAPANMKIAVSSESVYIKRSSGKVEFIVIDHRRKPRASASFVKILG